MSSEKKLVVPHDLFPWKPAKEAGKAPQEKLIVGHAPHWHDGSKISTKNYNIMIAALPAVLFGISQYGAPALQRQYQLVAQFSWRRCASGD